MEKFDPSKIIPSHIKSKGLPANGILLLYNQFPRCYLDINQMALQLPEIAEMGFNAVWINPIQETGKQKHPLGQDPLKLGKNSNAYSGSLYATKDVDKIDDAFSTDKKNNKKNNVHDIEALKNFTKIAKANGLAPIFDLVLNQVAIDADVYQNNPDWFIHPSAHFGRFCCDFNYNHPELNVRQAIMGYVKAQIKKYIVDFGFTGVRVDAVKHLPVNVQKEVYDYIRKLCNKYHKVAPIIYAEILGSVDPTTMTQMTQTELGITHVMNSLYFERFTMDYRKPNLTDYERRGFWEISNNAQQGMYDLRNIIYYTNPNALGGTLGFVGSHDEASLYDRALEDAARSIVEASENYGYPIPKFWERVNNVVKELEKLPNEKQEFYLKEKIAAIAFSSDAGWCLLSGDEFAHSGRKWVFDFYNPCENGKYSFKNHWGGLFDLRSFIKEVNNLLTMLPKPNPNFWLQHVVLDDKPELMFVVRHNGLGYDTIPEIITVNLSNNIVQLDKSDIERIAKQASIREELKNPDLMPTVHQKIIAAINQDNLFYIGKFQSNDLQIKNNLTSSKRSVLVEPLLTAIVKNEEIFFEEEWVNPDGDCGFTTLGTDRNKLVKSLLAICDNEEHCAFLAEEIENALLSQEVSNEMLQQEGWQYLYQNQLTLEEKIDTTINFIKEKFKEPTLKGKTHEEILAWLEENHPQDDTLHQLKELLSKLKINKNSMKAYCKDPTTVETYLKEYLKDDLWLGYKSALLYAKLNNISLYIFHKNENGQLTINENNIYKSSNINAAVIYMLHTSGFTHFNLLVKASEDKIIKYQQSMQNQSENYIENTSEKMKI